MNVNIFFYFDFVTQSKAFAKVVAVAGWPSFKMVSFLEYLVFSLSRFFAQDNSYDLYVQWILTCFLGF